MTAAQVRDLPTTTDPRWDDPQTFRDIAGLDDASADYWAHLVDPRAHRLGKPNLDDPTCPGCKVARVLDGAA